MGLDKQPRAGDFGCAKGPSWFSRMKEKEDSYFPIKVKDVGKEEEKSKKHKRATLLCSVESEQLDLAKVSWALGPWRSGSKTQLCH